MKIHNLSFRFLAKYSNSVYVPTKPYYPYAVTLQQLEDKKYSHRYIFFLFDNLVDAIEYEYKEYGEDVKVIKEAIELGSKITF